jgi:hypothetical protein
LSAYTNKYLEQKPAIDARIANLEKLVEEQARLTRAVESVKDEIAAQAKSRDNRWAFRKEVYVSLINACTDLISAQSGLQSLALDNSDDQKRLAECREAVMSCSAELVRYANLAPLATADSVQRIVAEAVTEMAHLASTEDELPQLQIVIDHVFSLRSSLQQAGRKDLWGTPEPEAKAEESAQG